MHIEMKEDRRKGVKTNQGGVKLLKFKLLVPLAYRKRQFVLIARILTWFVF